MHCSLKFRGPLSSLLHTAWHPADVIDWNSPSKSPPNVQVRQLNMYRDKESITHHKQLFSPRDMLCCWDQCLEKAQYHARRQAIQLFNAHNHWKKRGICAVPLKFGIGFSKGFYNQVGKHETPRRAGKQQDWVVYLSGVCFCLVCWYW